ncbi:hypothetical protein ACLBUQ_30355, partial [Pseudomonas aeruginosa]
RGPRVSRSYWRISAPSRRFLALLQSVQHWDISPSDELRLWPAEGKPLRLVPEHD